MTRLGTTFLAATFLTAMTALTVVPPVGAIPELAEAPAGLTPQEAQKLDPLLWRALAAETQAARGAPGEGGESGQGSGEALEAASAPWLALAAGVSFSEEGPLLDLLVRFEDSAAESARGVLAGHDLVPGAVLGPVATASRVPLAKVAELARDPAIARIEPATRYHVMNDVSVPETGAPTVWTQYSATGQGVIVAVIDTGIDPDHPDFQHPNKTTRILQLLDLAQPGNGPLGGTLFSSAQIDAGIKTSDPVGHGTHVAGTAAGGGQADLAFSGMAPEADLLIVNASRGGDGSFSSTDIVNSLAYVDARATALGKPYVANLSLGGHAGAHDGTALEEVAIDNLVGVGKAGKAVVIAAGNDRSGAPRHAQGMVEAAGLTINLGVPNYPPQAGSFNDYVAVSLWYEASSDFRITLTSPSNHTFGPFSPNQWNGESGESTTDGLVGVANALGGVDPENGDREVQIVIIDGPTPPADGTWHIRIDGDTGPVDAYVAQTTIGAQFTNHPAQGGFVAEPGTARNAITVGAYLTKLVWTDLDLNEHDLRTYFPNAEAGQLADFSNVGPTRDGRLKPEITAPGQEIASTYTADANPSVPVSAYRTPIPQFPNFFLVAGGDYAIQQGTSQASPHVAGAVALLLQLHPDWDQLDLRRALTGSARADAYTGPVPNDFFGFGKLDVLAAVEGAKTPGLPPPGDVDGDLTVDLDDAQMALTFVLGTASPTFEQGLRADMNRDLRLDVGDIVLIVRAVIAAGAAAPSGSELAGNPAPAEPTAGRDAWLLPIAIHPEVKGTRVSGVDLALAAGDPALAFGRVQAGGDGILALDGDGRKSGARRLIALAADGSDLAQRGAVFLLPFQADAAASRADWDVTALTLLAPNGKPVPGTVELGKPMRAGAPRVLRIVSLVPEPGHGERTIVIDVPDEAGADRPVVIAIYDAQGRHIQTLTREPLAPGEHRLLWDGRGARGPVATGIYWVRATLGQKTASARLTVLK
jgi:subtilisin family serine protease